MNFREIVASFAKKHEIIAGICDAAPIDPCRLLQSDFTPFVSSDIKKRTDPTASLKHVKSIVAIGVPHTCIKNCVSENTSTENTAQLSSLGTTEDYHTIVKTQLRKLKEELPPQTKSKILVDSPTLDERAFAHRAGIGFFGRNGLLISPKFGSRFNVGLLLTSIPFTPAEQTQQNTPAQSCPPNCKLCITTCPTNALKSNGLDVSRCISYLTQKDDLTTEEKLQLNNQLYGCDICQDICPFNQPQEKHHINPKEWLTINDETFTKKYGTTAMLWRGTKILRRNAQAAIQMNIIPKKR